MKAKILIITILAALSLPAASKAEQNMECKPYGLQIKASDLNDEVEFNISTPFKSDKIFRLTERTSFGHHENVRIVFSKENCTPLQGNLITCSGKPLRTFATPYWTSGPEHEIQMVSARIQTREMRALSILNNKPYESIQVLIGGRTENATAAEDIFNLQKNCR